MYLDVPEEFKPLILAQGSDRGRVGSGSGRSRGGVGYGLGGFSDWKVPCEKVCEVVWGTEDQQSPRKIIELFRSSLVMFLDV